MPGKTHPWTGPQAIYAAEDGSLYLLDQVNGRVLRFDAKKDQWFSPVS
ncbi:MAG: hypothetical protein WDN50_10390 [Bradyrhizobium sp.]